MRITVGWLTTIFLSCAIIESCGGNDPVSEPVLSDSFSEIQTRLITPTCAASGCHSGSFPEALLDLTKDHAYESMLHSKIQNSVGVEKYRALVVPFKPDSSFLYIKITNPTTLEGERMPQRQSKLPQNEIDAIRSWILRGAPND